MGVINMEINIEVINKLKDLSKQAFDRDLLEE